MPHHRGHNQSNKKGRKKGRKQNPAARGNGHQPSLLQRMNSALPSMNSNNVTSNASTAESGGYYSMYKHATLQFHNWMSNEACPNSKMSAVNDYRNGVLKILDRNRKAYLKENEDDLVVAPPEIMASLALSIRLREKLTAEIYGSQEGGDAGHRYIIDVLKYCRIALRFASRMATADYSPNDDEIGVQDAIGGRFNALTLDDDGEDSEDERDWAYLDRDIKDGNLPKYSGVEVKEDIDIQEILLNGDDRFQAMALLHTMDDLMGTIQLHYKQLKDYMRGNHGIHHGSSCMQLVMECAAVANVAIDSVNRAEIELEINHPHLSSFYHVLALVFLTDIVADLNTHIDRTRLKKDPHMSLQFVSEIVERCFREENRLDTIASIANRFVKKSGLEPRYVKQNAECIFTIITYEILGDFEYHEYSIRNPGYDAELTAEGVTPHMFLGQFEYIGEHCCILNTQKLVQVFADIIKDTEFAYGNPGRWGPPFDENSRLAGRIRGDLDAPLTTIILPELLKVCKKKVINELPDRSHLITVLDLFHQHVVGRTEKPVPVALSFGLHAVLMSIFVVQGNGDLARVAASAKHSYNMLFEQLQTMSDRSQSPLNEPHFYEAVQNCARLVELPKPLFGCDGHSQLVDPLEARMLTLWNPLIGGEYLLYATLKCSVGLGSTTIDSVGQLKFALHLYNGLRIRDPNLDVPFLLNLNTFSWTPKQFGLEESKGSCAKAFWMSLGIHAGCAASLASGHVPNEDLSSLSSMIRAEHWRRKMEGICPKKISVAYRRLVRHDFKPKDQENYSTNRPSSEANNVLSVNFPAIGSILLEFIYALSDSMEWSSMLQHDVRTFEVRSDKTMNGKLTDSVVRHLGLSNIWGRLLSCIDQDSSEFDVDKVAAVTKSFFHTLEKSRYIFHVEEGSNFTLTS